MNNQYFEEILAIINSNINDTQLKDALDEYHNSDIAEVLETLDREKRIKIYKALGLEDTADIFTYFDDVKDYVEEIPSSVAADLIEKLDSSDAVDVLNELEAEDKEEIISLLEDEDQIRVKQLDSYSDEHIASYMTDNFITINRGISIKNAMSQVIKEAGEHDNVNLIYVLDNKKYYGAINLSDLIVARQNDSLEDICMNNYPSFYEDELISDCINRLKDYKEASIPIINKDHILVGVITSENILDAYEAEFKEDYAKLAGLSDVEELHEPILYSVKKRLPWLIILLFLGLMVSSLIGIFEGVIASIPVIVFFQSMILGMGGNVGTQSLAVTIRLITEENNSKKLFKNVFKEIRIGFINGLLIGLVSFIFSFLYLYLRHSEIILGQGFDIYATLKVSSIIACSLLSAMTLSSLVGSMFPIILSKLHIDPAVASGPLITTINDIVAVMCYYGLTYLLFMMVL